MPIVQDSRIDAYIERAAPFAQPLLRHWRAAVHAACPDTVETLKWGMPFFMHGGRTLAQMAAFKQHCAFGIHAGEAAQNTERNDQAMGNFGRVATLADLPPRPELLRLLKAGVAAIDEGERTPRIRKSEPRPPPEPPSDLLDALAAEPAALARFQAFPPSQRREYVEWITEARRADTRARRLATTVAQCAEGKALNWRYERPRKPV